jgi:6-phospho-3-hexuloisomerase
MRLGHLGLRAYTVGDSTVPSIGTGDLFLVASGSGETQTIYDLVVRAKENGAAIALVTGNPGSRMGKLADVIVVLKAPSKTKPIDGFQSVQPMTTLNEQCLGIFFDALVLCLMEVMGETHDTMWKRHSNLE